MPSHFQRLLDTLVAAGAGERIQPGEGGGGGGGDDGGVATSLSVAYNETTVSITPVNASLMLLQAGPGRYCSPRHGIVFSF